MTDVDRSAAAAAVGIKLNAVRQNPAVVVKTHFPLGAISVPLAGGAHVVVFVVNHARGPAGFCRHQRRHHGRNAGLRFLAAETAPHPFANADDLVHVQTQRLGHNVLRFGWILRRTVNDNLPLLARICQGRLRFQIKLFLPQIVEHATRADAAPFSMPPPDRHGAICRGWPDESAAVPWPARSTKSAQPAATLIFTNRRALSSIARDSAATITTG